MSEHKITDEAVRAANRAQYEKNKGKHNPYHPLQYNRVTNQFVSEDGDAYMHSRIVGGLVRVS